jgi:hypothetical protein
MSEPINEDEARGEPRKPFVGLGIMLFICYAILVALLPSQSPAVPFSGFMPSDLWVVSGDKIARAAVWVWSIFGIYLAIGITGWLGRWRILCWAVPATMIAGSLIAVARFVSGMNSFNR